MTLSIIGIVAGLGLLIAAGDSLVKGASSVAKKLGMAPIVIGLTIVAFGTSAPELIVNIFAAVSGNTDIAVGNVVGSNIANILLILGVSAIIFPLSVKGGTVWKEVPFALLAAVLVLIMGVDSAVDKLNFNALTRSDGLSLIAFFTIFLYYTYGLSKTEGSPEPVNTFGWPKSILLTLGGIAGLFFGGKILVDGAVNLATLAGLSEAIIGVTIIAVGTSLPELVTSIIAARNKNPDIAVGNVVGSNIFNIFWILGLSATINPLPISSQLIPDIIISVLVTILLFVVFFTGKKHDINRKEGIFFILAYVGYLIYTVMRIGN